MSERDTCTVHTEGDPSDVLFILPPFSRRMSEGDTFNVTLAGGSLVNYKVEKVTYTLVQSASGNLNNPHDFWHAPKVYYGVSIVP